MSSSVIVNITILQKKKQEKLENKEEGWGKKKEGQLVSASDVSKKNEGMKLTYAAASSITFCNSWLICDGFLRL